MSENNKSETNLKQLFSDTVLLNIYSMLRKICLKSLNSEAKYNILIQFSYVHVHAVTQCYKLN